MTASSADGCRRKTTALGLCDAYYNRRRRGVPVTGQPLRAYGTKGCSVRDCDRRHAARGLCFYHYRQMRTSPRRRWRTPAEVEEMRGLHAQGVSFEELGRRFDCAATTAARICKRISFPDS
ncbi:MAG: hypothetical protein FGM52_13160 [Mycobacterium sp.]|nr:hypothetical protein [Mycobacterium sp.]